MSTHTGAVTVVRFSPNGRYLASGSDDRVVLIWEKDESRIPRKEFGSQGEADSESWVARKRLIGHDNDVQDLAWAPDSSLLVTVGLDSSIIIWSGSTFEKLKRFDAHQSHVKGITFDPANKYFATASDDRTVRIIRYHKSSPNEITFSIESSISSPFIGSPISTYFRRLSWSPDGNHIAAANATNGPVATIAIINRGTWDSDISLIGHEAPVEVAAFCPRVFATVKPDVTVNSKNSSSENDSKNTNNNNNDNSNNTNLITVVATAGQDKTLAIWNTSNPRPLLVARNIAEKAITDIVWSPDGTKMFASSLDGSILIACFEEGELGWPIPQEEAQLQLTRYGGRKDEMQIPESVEQLVLEEKIADQEKVNNEKKMDEIMGVPENGISINGFSEAQREQEQQPIKQNSISNISNVPMSSSEPPSSNSNSLPSNVSSNTVNNIPSPASAPPVKAKTLQKITITKDGKKRVAPQLLTTTSVEPRISQTELRQQQAASVTGGIASEPYLQAIELSKPSYALPKGGVSSLVIGTKRKASEDKLESGDEGAGSTNNANGNGVVKRQKQDEIPEFIRPAIVSPATTISQVRLAVPKVQTFFSRNVEGISSSGGGSGGGRDRTAVLEVRNGTGNEQEPTKITVTKRGQVVFVDFLPKFGHLAAGNGVIFWAVATEDGVIYIYGPSGRRLMPTIVLGSSITFLESQGEFLMAITSIGMVHVWDIKRQVAVLRPPVSVAPILDTSTKYLENGLLRAPNITQCGVTNKGHIIITLNNGYGYTYNEDMMIWQRISESWHAFGSQYWDSTGMPSIGSMGISMESSPAYKKDSNNRATGGVVGGGYKRVQSGGLVALVERRTNEEVVLKGGTRGRYLQRLAKNRMLQEGYEGFEGVVSIAHLETRIGAAILLESADELRWFLVMYARRVAEEGMKDRLDELCRDLLGPAAGDLGQEHWKPSLCGISKHDLLKEVLLVVGKFREVQQVILPFATSVGLSLTS